MCPSLPDDVCEIIVKQFHGEYVLTVRRVSKTWNQFVSNVQMIEAFAGLDATRSAMCTFTAMNKCIQWLCYPPTYPLNWQYLADLIRQIAFL